VSLLKQHFISEYENGVIEEFDALEITHVDQVIDAVRSISLFDKNKLVIIRDFSQNNSLVDRIDYIVDSTTDTTQLVLVDTKLDRRYRMFKFLQKEMKLEECKDLDPHDLANELLQEAERLSLKMNRSQEQRIVQRAGNNQERVFNELNKIAAYSSTVEDEIIDLLIDQSPQADIFIMLEHLFYGRTEKAWLQYKDLRAQGEEPYKIIAMLFWQMQSLAAAVFAHDGNPQTVQEAGLSPYVAKKALVFRSRLTRANVKELIDELVAIDVLSKQNADVESALEYFFCKAAVLCQLNSKN